MASNKKEISVIIKNNIQYKIYFVRLFTNVCYYYVEITSENKDDTRYMRLEIINNKIFNFQNDTEKLRNCCKQWLDDNIDCLEYYFENLKKSD